MTNPSGRRRLLIGLVVVSYAAVAGCAGGTGTLTGTVTYQGKPVVFGAVTVQAADGSRRMGNIEPDGTYTVTNVPTGRVTIAVSSPEPPAPAPASAPSRLARPGYSPPPPAPAVDRSKWVKLPDQYADPVQSELTTTVSSGTNTFNIELK
jgi:hypothetical protein